MPGRDETEPDEAESDEAEGDDVDDVDDPIAAEIRDSFPDDGGDAIEAMARAYELKDETRTGWQLRDVADPESVAAHAWGVAVLVLRFCPPDVDRGRALELAVAHDVAEAVTGDYATRAESGAETVAPAEKTRRERAALDGPLEALGPAFRDAWTEYEAHETPEARFVKDADLLDTCLQALVYEREGRYDPDADNPNFEAYDDLDEFFATSEPRLSTDRGRALFERIEAEYRAAKAHGDRCSG